MHVNQMNYVGEKKWDILCLSNKFHMIHDHATNLVQLLPLVFILHSGYHQLV